jgi:hypothetical protein
MIFIEKYCATKYFIICMITASFLCLSLSSAAKISKVKTSCKQNLITIPIQFSDFELEVIEWISHCVKSRTKKNGKSVRREFKLVKNNKTLSNTWHRIKNLQGEKVGLIAKYIGKNKVKKIIFSQRGFDSEVLDFEGDVILVDSLVKKRWKYKLLDLKKGKKIFKSLRNVPKKTVKKIVTMPRNLVGTPDKKEAFDIFRKAHPISLVKYTVGGLIDVLTANQSGNVSKKRKSLYSSYSEGVAQALDNKYISVRPKKNSMEYSFYQLGLNKVKQLKPLKKHQLRLYLIEYYRTYGLKGGNPLDSTLSYFKSKYRGNLYQVSMNNAFQNSDSLYR